jgi:DNA-directed RNA polymerase specialized sigma24 family protein
VSGGSSPGQDDDRTAWLADEVAFSAFYRGHAQALLVFFTRVDLAGLGSLRAVIAQELSRLSGEQRDALQLRVVDELLPYTDVATRLGISEQAARMRVSRGLSALARAVESARPPIEESP